MNAKLTKQVADWAEETGLVSPTQASFLRAGQSTLTTRQLEKLVKLFKGR